MQIRGSKAFGEATIDRREEFSGQRLLGSSIIALLAFAYTVWTVIGSGAQTVLDGFVLLMIGIPVYVWMRKQQADSDISSSVPVSVPAAVPEGEAVHAGL